MQKSRAISRQWSLSLLFASFFCILTSSPVWAIVSASPSNSSGTHTISWAAVSGVSDYKINTSLNGSIIKTRALSNTSKSITETESGTYTYSIIAIKEKMMPSGELINTPSPVGSVNVSVVIPAPGVPASIAIPSTNTSGSVTVSWGAASGSVNYYELYEKINSGSYSKVFSGVEVATSLSGRADASYNYQVRACNASACGGYRAATGATTVRKIPGVSGAPSNPVTSVTGLFSISWTAAAGTVTYYDLQKKIGSGSWSTIYTGSTRSFSPPSFAEGNYSFRVVACNAYSWSCSTSAEKQTVVDYPDTSAVANPPATNTGSVSTVSWGETFTGFSIKEYPTGREWTITDTASSYPVAAPSADGDNYRYSVANCRVISEPGSSAEIARCGNYGPMGSTMVVRHLPSAVAVPTLSSSFSADGALTVSWSKPSGTVTKYYLQKQLNDSGWTNHGASQAGLFSSVTGLSQGDWKFRINACNEFDWACSNGAPSAEYAVRTTPSAAVAPTLSTATSITGAVNLSWTAPAGSVTKYYVQKDFNNAGNWQNDGASFTSTSKFLSGLAQGDWKFRIIACNEFDWSCSTGATSADLKVRTVPSTAVAPSLSATTSITGVVNLNWTAPAGSATKYYVQKDFNSAGNWQNDGVAISTTGKSLSGLAQADWKFRIVACNEFDWSCSTGATSAELKVRAVPAVPTTLSISTAQSNGSVVLDWADVTGATYYDVQNQSSAQAAVALSASTATIATLNDGDWQYKVRACNQYSWACSTYGNLSSNITVRNKPGSPGVPNNPANSDSGIYSIGWAASSGTATYYSVQESINAGSSWQTIFEDTALTRSTSVNHSVEGTYHYRVLACNEFNWACTTGATSQTVVSFTAPAGAPVAPTKNNGSSLTITWPTAWGNGWWLTEHPSNRSWHAQGGNSHTISSPPDGSYTYTIAGCAVLAGDGGDYNCRTESAHSNTLQVRRPPVLQGEIDLAANSITGDITVSWLLAAPNGDSYRVTEVNSGVTQTLSNSITSTVFTGRANGVHQYQYQACNNLDFCSPLSATAQVSLLLVPKMQGALALPTSSNNGTYSLAWAAATSAVASYQVREQSSGVWSGWIDTGAVRSYSPSSAKADGTYAYEVQACNASGCSALPLSASVNVLHPAALPPVGLTATTSGDSRYVQLDWQASGDGFDDYYEYRLAGGTWQVTTGQMSTVTTVPASGAYTFEVRACNNIPGGVKCSIAPAQVNSGQVTIPQAWAEGMPFGVVLPDAPYVALAPENHDATVGVLAGSGGVDGGAANYNIPVQLPPGRAGMSPSVSVSYSSRAGSGVLGMGWQLNAGSAIARCAQTLVHDGNSLSVQLDQSVDRLCIDGERLLVVSGVYGSSNTVYSPQSNPLVKVLQQGALDAQPTFEVTSANGHKRFYGTRENSAFKPEGVNQALAWHISYEQDLAGNTVNYFYEAFGGGEYHLSDIWFTGTDDYSGDRKVKFHYGPAIEADISSQYLAGGLTRQTKRLDRIEVSLAGELLREYRFQFLASRASGRSLMDSVQECANSAGQLICLEKTRFTWEDAKPTFVLEKVGFRDSSATENYLENNGADLAPQFQSERFIDDIAPQGDVDGNGVSDWNSVDNTQSQNTVVGWHTNAEGFKVRDNLTKQQACQYNSLAYRRVCTSADFNLDGKTDNWRATANYFEFAYSFDASGNPQWFSTAIPVKSDSSSEINDRIESIGDFNGDGFPDLVIRSDRKSAPSAKLYLHLHTGNFANPYNASGQLIYTYLTTGGLSPRISSTAQFVGDLDGNGLPDFVDASTQLLVAGTYTSSPQPTPKYIYLTRVSAQNVVTFEQVDLTAIRQARVALGGGIGNLNLHFNFFMDVNADGLTDWLSLIGDEMAVALNKGGNFGSWQLIDGAEGLLATRDYPYYKTGDGGTWELTAVPKYSNSFKLMDINADGRVELLMPGTRVVTNCQEVYDLASKGMKCGDALYGIHRVDQYGQSLAVYPVDELDESLYQYKALSIIEKPEGGFRAKFKPTGIVASATQMAVVDVFGNGLNDVVFSYGCRNAPGCSWQNAWSGGDFGSYVYRNRGSAEGAERYEPTDMLVAVENGMAVRDEWHYRPLSSQDSRYHSGGKPFYERGGYLDSLSGAVRADHLEFTSSMYVVARHQQSNGIGGMNAEEYRYKGAVFNHRGRGFQGFHSIITENLAAQLESQNDFHQIYPLAGKLHKVRQWPLGDRTTDASATEAMDQTDVTWQLWPKGNFAQLTNVAALTDQWTVAANTPYFVSQASQQQQVRRLQSSAGLRDVLYTQSQTQTADEWGNVTLAEQRYAQANDSHVVRQETETTYAPDESQWWFNKPTWQQTRHFAIENRTGTAIEAGTDTDRFVSLDYLNWNSQLRVPTAIKTTPSSGKTNELLTGDFDNYGQPRQITARAEGETDRVTTTQYSSDGYFVESVTNALLHSNTRSTSAAHGQPEWLIDTNGLRTDFGYDAFGRLTSVQAPGQAKAYTRLQWCGLGQCDSAPQARFKTIQQQAGSPAQVSYHDALGRAVQTEVEGFSGLEWLVSQVQYNALGQTTFESVPAFNSPSNKGIHSLNYDLRGRLTHKVTDQTRGQSLEVTYVHEQEAGFTTAINANGLELSRTYNGLGQLVQTVDAIDGVTTYAYNGAGLPIVLQDANSNRITANYNGLGQKLWVKDPNMGQKSFTYTGFGEVDTETDANGITTDYNYDALGRVYQRKVNGQVEAGWVYDTAAYGIGLPASEVVVANGDGRNYSRSFQYDSLSRPEAITSQIDGESYTVKSHYDANLGRVKGLQYPNGLALSYGYTDTGYQATVKNAASGYVYRQITDQDTSGQWRSAIMAQGLLNVQRNFDLATGQLIANQLDDPMGMVHQQSYSDFDSFGNLREQITEVPSLSVSAITESYVYDDMHRLKENHRSNGASIYYNYDAVGNLLQKGDFANSYQYTGAKPNAVSRVDLVAGGSISYGYDNNGNRTHENGAETLRYNAFNKPTRIVRNGATVEFSYGANQMRYKQVAGGKTTLYIDKLFEKISAAGEDQYRLFIEDIAVLTHTVKTDGTSSHKIGFTHRDRLGSTVAVSDHLGVLQESQSYDPFGKPRAGDLADLLNAIVNSSFTTRGFTDHEHLDDVKLIHMNGRAYDYELGRFLSVDPVIQAPGNSQSLNPYSYIMNNPMSGTDPSGYKMEEVTGSRIKRETSGLNTGTASVGGSKLSFSGGFARAPSNGAAGYVDGFNVAKIDSETKSSGGGASGIGGISDRGNVGGSFGPSPKISSEDTDNRFAMNHPDMETGATRSVGGIEELGEVSSSPGEHATSKAGGVSSFLKEFVTSERTALGLTSASFAAFGAAYYNADANSWRLPNSNLRLPTSPLTALAPTMWKMQRRARVWAGTNFLLSSVGQLGSTIAYRDNFKKGDFESARWNAVDFGVGALTFSPAALIAIPVPLAYFSYRAGVFDGMGKGPVDWTHVPF